MTMVKYNTPEIPYRTRAGKGVLPARGLCGKPNQS